MLEIKGFQDVCSFYEYPDLTIGFKNAFQRILHDGRLLHELEKVVVSEPKVIFTVFDDYVTISVTGTSSDFRWIYATGVDMKAITFKFFLHQIVVWLASTICVQYLDDAADIQGIMANMEETIEKLLDK